MPEESQAGMPNVPPVSQPLTNTVMLVDLCVTLVIFFAMLLDHRSVVIALLACVSFFVLFGIASLLILSQALTIMVVNGQNQRTLRDRDKLYRQVVAPVPMVESPKIVEPPRLPEWSSAATFVAPHASTIRSDAAAWLHTLYGPDGLPDPARVNLSDRNEKPGRIRRKHPSPEVCAFLVQHRIVQEVNHGLRLNLPRYGTVDSVDRALS